MLRILTPAIAATPGLEMNNFLLKPPDEYMSNNFVLDEKIGFRPILGNSLYNKYCTLVNQYEIKKKHGVRRVLFLGDSVTARGKIIDFLKGFYGEDKFEYWNAGVEGFNTEQEVFVYFEYNAKIEPDHVILFFHYNDFDATPVVFLNKNNEMVFYAFGMPKFTANLWLIKNSYLYRILNSAYSRILYKQAANLNNSKAKEIKKSLKTLQGALKAKNIRFTVVVLPVLDTYDKWTAFEKSLILKINEMLSELSIEYIDLLPVINDAANKFELFEQSLLDRQHPNDELSKRIAKFLFDKKIFYNF